MFFSFCFFCVSAAGKYGILPFLGSTISPLAFSKSLSGDVRTSQIPCKAGWPSAVRGALYCAAAGKERAPKTTATKPTNRCFIPLTPVQDLPNYRCFASGAKPSCDSQGAVYAY